MFALQTLILAFSLAWGVLANVNFLYGVFHDHTGIAEGIERFGPKNRYKSGFGETSRSERIRLFEQINLAVHNGGNGLSAIEYESSASDGPQKMLRMPEQVHLQDVANLLDILKWVVGLNLILWFAAVVSLLFFQRFRLSLKGQSISLAAVAGASVLVLLIVGPVAVFNQLHIWIFPDNHQWFFYYQESLMSTLMLAPNLFGWIALALVALAVPMFFCLTQLVVMLDRRIINRAILQGKITGKDNRER